MIAVSASAGEKPEGVRLRGALGLVLALQVTEKMVPESITPQLALGAVGIPLMEDLSLGHD